MPQFSATAKQQLDHHGRRRDLAPHTRHEFSVAALLTQNHSDIK